MISLLDNERIILKKRRHWLVIALELAPLALLSILPGIFLLIDSATPVVNIIISEYIDFVIFFLFAWWLFLWMISFVVWTNYYLDVLIITNKRIIDIEQLGLFARDIVEVRVEKIEDIKTEIIGFVSSLLHMGNLYIQTAGESKEVVIKNIPNPNEVREIIAKCGDEA